MQISDYMKSNVISIPSDSSIRQAAALFVKHHIGLLPVVDRDHKPMGVLGLKDMLSLELPDFVRFIADVDFVHDFGAVETTRPPAETLNKSVVTLMRPPISVQGDSGLLRTYALMLQHNVHDILVVDKEGGKLIGIASRVDIGSAILSTWEKVE
jgi:CBS domain-containing protein